MKICPSCNVEKLIAEFNSQGKYCKDCHNKKGRLWRKNNPTKNKLSQKKYQKKTNKPSTSKLKQKEHSRNFYLKNREKIISLNKERRKSAAVKLIVFVLDYLLTHPCVDCGEKNPIKLTFDHVKGIKKCNISNMVSNGSHSLNSVIEEIDKCEVRCANCHMFKTAKDGKFRMYKMLEEVNFKF